MTREELQAEYSAKLKELQERGNVTDEEKKELLSYFDKAEELGMNYLDLQFKETPSSPLEKRIDFEYMLKQLVEQGDLDDDDMEGCLNYVDSHGGFEQEIK